MMQTIRVVSNEMSANAQVTSADGEKEATSEEMTEVPTEEGSSENPVSLADLLGLVVYC